MSDEGERLARIEVSVDNIKTMITDLTHGLGGRVETQGREIATLQADNGNLKGYLEAVDLKVNREVAEIKGDFKSHLAGHWKFYAGILASVIGVSVANHIIK